MQYEGPFNDELSEGVISLTSFSAITEQFSLYSDSMLRELRSLLFCWLRRISFVGRLFPTSFLIERMRCLLKALLSEFWKVSLSPLNSSML